MLLDRLRSPVVLAPLAGGPGTVELAAAVGSAGGFGFLPSGYLTAAATSERIAALRRLTDEPFGVNLFTPAKEPSDPAAYESYVDRLERWAQGRGTEIGRPEFDDDDYEAKLELLGDDAVAVVSFTFGCPTAATVDTLHAAGSEVWVSVTSPAEAGAAVRAGADALVVQGNDAGGHRASFVDRERAPDTGLLALLDLIRSSQPVDLVAAGGIATGAALAAVLCAGAKAAQIGSAFMLCPEAGTTPAHRRALRTGGETSLTRAFTGRLARGIRNEFMDEHDAAAPIAYPEIHNVTAPLRRAAREKHDASQINLWAGTTHALAREVPAAQIVHELVEQASATSATVAARLAGA